MIGGSMLHGLLATVTCIGASTIILRIFGLGRAEALYLACLGFTVVAYVLSRRALRRRSRD